MNNLIVFNYCSDGWFAQYGNGVMSFVGKGVACVIIDIHTQDEVDGVMQQLIAKHWGLV